MCAAMASSGHWLALAVIAVAQLTMGEVWDSTRIISMV